MRQRNTPLVDLKVRGYVYRTVEPHPHQQNLSPLTLPTGWGIHDAPEKQPVTISCCCLLNTSCNPIPVSNHSEIIFSICLLHCSYAQTIEYHGFFLPSQCKEFTKFVLWICQGSTLAPGTWPTSQGFCPHNPSGICPGHPAPLLKNNRNVLLSSFCLPWCWILPHNTIVPENL